LYSFNLKIGMTSIGLSFTAARPVEISVG